MTHTLRIVSLVACVALTASCASWRPVQEHEGWTLYVQDGSQVEVPAFEAAIWPALSAVEHVMGPFEDHVNVHAFEGGVLMDSGNGGRLSVGGDGTIGDVAGVGPARVHAFHSRSSGDFLSPSGIFIGTAETGTMVHELVHARFAEEGVKVPLWFEEGFAMLLGDGCLHRNAWYVDGLACWPWRELRDLELDDTALTQVLDVRADVSHSIENNVLAHIVGWAIVFDLYREAGTADWRWMLARFRQAEDPLAEARLRLARTLEDETVYGWLERLEHESPGIRMATVKGLWKLGSRDVLYTFLRQLREEEDDEVRVALAMNALATVGERRSTRKRVSWRQERWLSNSILPVLRETELDDPNEQAALLDLHDLYTRGAGKWAQEPFNRLIRFYGE